MTKSKRDRVDEFLRSRIQEALADLAFSTPETLQFCRTYADVIKARVTHRAVWDAYRWLEFCDIMDWKKRTVRE